MKLSKIYSNKPDIFMPVRFRDGINIVLAEIRMPENRNKATHNLGKSIFGSLIDFCLLAGTHKSKKFFLKEHNSLFYDFVFFLEIELFDNSFLTIRRSASEMTKISFKKHPIPNQDFSWLSEDDSNWDHCKIPLDSAKELLDSILDLKTIKPWNFRKSIGYLIRSQDDYSDVYQLKKFKGNHSDWKPYLIKLIGGDGELLEKIYNQEDNILKKITQTHALQYELNSFSQKSDLGKLDGLLLLKRKEVSDKTRLLDELSFFKEDTEKTRHIVDDLDREIADLNMDRYKLMQMQKTIKESLEREQLLFDPQKAQSIFQEAGILFNGQIKKDFEQLITFNKAITEERSQYLKKELKDIETNLAEVNETLLEQTNKRKDLLAFLKDANVFDKYKRSSDEIVTLRTEIESLESLKSGMQRLNSMLNGIDSLKNEQKKLLTLFSDNIRNESSNEKSLFSKIRLFFDEIVKSVIGQNALINITINEKGHPEFSEPTLLNDNGKETSAGKGHSYTRLLCVAFDLAIMRAYLEFHYPRFLFHDGILESLEPRKKENLFEIIRQYSQLGIQHIVTLLDSEVPSESTFFEDAEVILRLHDKDANGRLFRMESW